MSLPSDPLVRQAIESTPIRSMQIAFEADYLCCGRIGEMINRKHFSDKTANPTGMHLTCRKEVYTPDINNPFEYQTVNFAWLMQKGRQPTINQILKIKEPVAIFTVTTEKRMGWKREIALPLNPKYEPWTEGVYEWIKKFGGESFPFTRQQMHTMARKIFAGMNYTIKPYKRARIVNGQYLYDEKERLIKDVVSEHVHPFANHGLRHLRDSVLKNYYGLNWEERHFYGGWSLGTEERYGENVWRLYFYKLCKPIVCGIVS
jgi:hypothetical protein